MRILLLNDRIPPENRGGAGEVVWRLALAFRAAGHDVHVAAATAEDSFIEERQGIPTYHLHVAYPLRWRAWLSLYNPRIAGALQTLYQQIQPDIINAHNIHLYLSYHTLTLARRMGIPAIFSSHDVMPFAYNKLSHFIDRAHCGVRSPAAYKMPRFFNLRQMRLRYNPMRNLFIRRILQRSTQCRTAPSQELADAHHANGLPPFTVVHNGIDADAFAASDAAVAQLRQRLNLHGRKVILFAGRLTGSKGTGQLLQAMELMVDSVPEMMLLVLSSQSIESQVGYARFDHLRENHMVSGGWLAGEDLAAAFRLADVVTAPSIIFDSFPTVNLEAMAAGTPVVATCYGGGHEAVVEGETGYLINPFDVPQYAQRLTHLLRDDALRERMGRAGYAHVRRHFPMTRQVDEMLALYQSAISAMNEGQA